ncbi:MAG: hypothetical protein J6A01_08965 [Proteobacteria bacterium]|nr:hypothetical protein [Pseudomonadota bacterium]
MKKAFYVALLGILFGAGCSENVHFKPDVCDGCLDGVGLCNNGVLDEGEVCDGNQFLPGYGACPVGTVGAPQCVNCLVVTAGYCFPASTSQNVCGNGILEPGESCDGSVFATGLSHCPEGTTGMPACISCMVVTDGYCKPAESTCNNGVLEQGEQCDGDLFAPGYENCPEGKEGKPTCVNCLVSTDACTDIEPTGCNNNGVLDPGELCDGEEFAEGMGGCPEGTQGKPVCVGCQIVTKDVCKENPCEDGLKLCEEKVAKVCNKGEWEVTECLDEQICWEGACMAEGFQCKGDTLVLCEDAECVEEDCTESGKVCDSENPGCVYDYQQKCEDNILTIIASDGDKLDINCSAEGKLCNETAGDCDKHDFTCDGSVIKITGTSYSYDCAKNEDDKKGCNSYTGCDDIYCDGKKLMMIVDGAAEIYMDCSVYNNGICSDELKDCVSTDDVEGCYVNDNKQNVYYLCDKSACVEEVCPQACDASMGCYVPCEENQKTCDHNQVMICQGGQYKPDKKCDNQSCYHGDCYDDVEYCDGNTYYLCIADECAFEDCSESGQKCDPENPGCVKVDPGCGNSVIESNEVCEFTDKDANVFYWVISQPSCNYYDASKIFVSGAPQCHAEKCKVDVSSCVEATESDYTLVKEWQFTSQTVINNLTKTKDVEIHNLDNTGFKTSTYVSADNAWQIGPWYNESTPNYDAYMWFKVGVTKDTIRITFDIKRTNDGPKKIQLQYLNASTELAISESYDVTTSYSTVTAIYRPNKPLTDFGFKLTGYNAVDGSTKAIYIKNVKIHQVKAL